MIYLYFYLVKQKQKLKRKMTVNNIRIIQEVLDNNSQNIPENDLMTGLNALMAINNSQSNEKHLAQQTDSWLTIVGLIRTDISLKIINPARDPVGPIGLIKWWLGYMFDKPATMNSHASPYPPTSSGTRLLKNWNASILEIGNLTTHAR